MSGNPSNTQRIPTDVKLDKGVGFHGFVTLYGCESGEHAMVGEGRVVTADLPPRASVTGNPAQLLTNWKGACA